MGREGLVNHYAGVRIRATGSGNLHSELQSMDELQLDTLANLALAATNSSESIIIANFTSQRASLYLFTNQLDDNFKVSKITVYIKPTATGYPQ